MAQEQALYPPSALTPYLATNEPIPSSQKAVFNAYIAHLGFQIDVLDGEIAALFAMIKDKRRKKEELKQERITWLGLKSPLRDFPAEILATIFHLVVVNPEDPDVEALSKISRLRGVCRRWRDVLRTTPNLWIRFMVNVDQWSTPRLRFCNNLELHDLLRMELSPLGLIVGSFPWIHVDFEPSTLAQSDINHFRRCVWRLLQSMPEPRALTLPSGISAYETLMAIPPSNALAYLGVHEDGNIHLADLNSRFPSLKMLTILDMIPRMTHDLLYPHSSLQSLYVNNWTGTPTLLWRTLRGLPCLRELSLMSKASIDFNLRQRELLTHQSLQDLTLCPENLLFLFHNLTLANLCSLVILGRGIAVLPDTVPNFFSPTTNKALCISFNEDLLNRVIQQLIQYSPPQTRIHLMTTNRIGDDGVGVPLISMQSDCVEEVVCTPDLDWIGDDPPPRSPSHPLRVVIPAGTDYEEDLQGKEEKLRRAGYWIHRLDPEVFIDMIDALEPKCYLRNDGLL